MSAPPMPADEQQRLEALHNLCVLDTPPDPRFDRITRLACALAKTPIALICFVDAHRQWAISGQGLDLIETSRENSFCGHAILREEPLVVPDTLHDPRFADNPFVTGSPRVRFYTGHPIHAPGGARVGTLCVLDTLPRNLSIQELEGLRDLSTLVDAELLAIRFNIATRTAGVGVHERRADARYMWWSDAMWDLFGQDPSTFRASADNWLAVVHPEDQDHVRANGGAWGKPRTSLSLQYRIIRPDGSIRHLQSIASSTEKRNGSIDRIAGITLDVTDRVHVEQREQGQQRQLRENSHQAGMAEVATAVLDSVGNVVNSLGIANATVRRDLRALRLDQLEQATALLDVNRATLASFLTTDKRGQHLPDFLRALSSQISGNVQAVHAELDTADQLLQHLRDIVSAQQVHANVGSMCEPINFQELIDTVLVGHILELPPTVDVVRQYEDLPLVTTDRRKLRLILSHLLDNARDAVLANGAQSGRIVVQLRRDESHALAIVEDSGVGMSPDVLSHLWRFGYTTKPNGQGFDLHNSANAAREIGASIAAESDGLGKGSRFIVRLPINKEG